MNGLAMSANFETTIAANNRFEILSEIGQGSNSTVYLARPLSLLNDRRTVVLKVVDEADVDALIRAQREAYFLEECRSRWVVGFHGAVFEGGVFYLVMEYAAGGHMLKAWLGRKCYQSIKFFHKVSDDLLSALSWLHIKNVLHRNVRPESILLNADCSVCLGSMSRAAHVDEQIQLVGWQCVEQRFDYIPPETLRNARYDQRSEIYAAGVLLYELLCGRSPFDGLSQSDKIDCKMSGLFTAPSAIAPELPNGLDRIVLKAIETDPQNRYHSIADFRLALSIWYKEHTKGVYSCAPELAVA
jgi:serine/threonine-protein kinase